MGRSYAAQWCMSGCSHCAGHQQQGARRLMGTYLLDCDACLDGAGTAWPPLAALWAPTGYIDCWTATLTGVAGAALAAIDKFLGTLWQTQDATPHPATGALHLMCDMAHAVAHAISQAQQEQHQAGRQGGKPQALPEVPKLPGSAPLVKGWFGQMRARCERLPVMQCLYGVVLPGSLLRLQCMWQIVLAQGRLVRTCARQQSPKASSLSMAPMLWQGQHSLHAVWEINLPSSTCQHWSHARTRFEWHDVTGLHAVTCPLCHALGALQSLQVWQCLSYSFHFGTSSLAACKVTRHLHGGSLLPLGLQRASACCIQELHTGTSLGRAVRRLQVLAACCMEPSIPCWVQQPCSL